jgi:outer membrane cobalamin receptor
MRLDKCSFIAHTKHLMPTSIKMNFKIQVSLILLVVLCVRNSYGQVLPADSLAKYYDMSLEQLQALKGKTNSSELEKVINTLLSVSSQKALSSRESPSIVSVITEEDIRKSGARDLVDVLRTVPGLEFAYDGESAIGIGARGNWANEGKILLLIDGQQVNEIFSGSLSFGNRYPLSSISRIEIIRGPGSAIYGGFAELGVINVITKSGDQLNGVQIQGTYGQMSDSYGRRNMEINAGRKWNETSVSLSGMFGEGQRSDRTAFASFQRNFSKTKSGTYQSLAGRSDANPLFFNLKFAHKGFTFKAIYDGYESASLDLIDADGKSQLKVRNQNINLDASQEFKLSEKFTITSKGNLIRQTPKQSGLPDSSRMAQNHGTRIGGSISGSYHHSRKIDLSGGIQFYRDVGTNSLDSIPTVSGHATSIDYNNWAGYLQVTAKTNLANFILGGRYDRNSKYGYAFVPRVALTKRIDQWHFKAIFSSAFRAPTIENIAGGVKSINTFEPGIKAEKTTVFEVETGYQLTKNCILTVNAFHSTISNPIVNLAATPLYTNYDQAGSEGIEAEFHFKDARWDITAGYSFYSVANRKKVDAYTLREFTPADSLEPTGPVRNDAVLLGFPAHKLTTKAIFNVTKQFSIGTTLLYNSKRYGYDATPDGSGTYTFHLQDYDQNFIAHVFLCYDNVVHGLNLGVGVNNVFNNAYVFATPYYAGASALPAQSREFLLKAVYKIDLAR